MISSGFSVLLGLIHPFLGTPVAWLAWPFPALTIRLVSAAARMPHAALPLTPFWRTLGIALYPLLLLPLLASARLQEVKLSERLKLTLRSFIIVILLVSTLLTWQKVVATPDGKLHLVLIDNGSQSTVLITTPSGRSVLIGAGESSARLATELGQHLPYLQPKLDWWIMTSNDDSSLLALDGIIDHIPIEAVVQLTEPGTYNYRSMMDKLAKRNVSLLSGQPEQLLDLGNGISLTILASGADGSALSLTYQNMQAVLLFGSDPKVIQSVYRDPDLLAPAILLLADSGSLALNPPDSLHSIQPGLVLISAAAGNPANNPANPVLDALEERTVLRTDLHGSIHLSSNGYQLWIESERIPHPPHGNSLQENNP